MAASTVEALFVTANVGSIFEDPASMLKIWTDEFLSTVSHLHPKVIALHCQEVGGKNYERSMQHVTDFVKLLMKSEELQYFDKVRIFLDEDYSSAEHFTALGNFYFIHESISEENVQIFDFEECKFFPVVGKEIHSGNIEDVSTKEKSKFPQEIFPECKWSRKGFMRTRWNLNGTVFDLVNIHLFHDASNFVAMESFPSVYCKNRQRALEHTLKRFHTDRYGTVPFFVFGDFNFRTDTQGVVKRLVEGLNAVSIQSSKSSDHTKLQYRDESSQQVVLTLGKKEFSHQDHQKLFLGEDREWLKEFDRELESFDGQLFEFSINFPPTYPYVEDSERGEMYMQTRCPSWCDRVFLSSSARALVNHVDGEPCVQYGLIGQNACMGDHKPVFLLAALVGGIGTVSCCALPATPCTSRLCATSPVEHLCRLCSEQSVGSSLPFYEPEQDNNGLRVPTFHHHTSPYTPDSTDTEPDIPEEQYSNENSDFQNKRLQALSSHRLVSNTVSSLDEDEFWLDASNRKGATKIPSYIRPGKKEDNAINAKIVSKIPVLQFSSSCASKDVKGKNVKGLSLNIQCHRDNFKTEEQNSSDIRPPCEPVSSVNICSPSSAAPSLIPKFRSGDGRKVLSRQKNIEEMSSDSDTEDSDKFCDGDKPKSIKRNDRGEAKVEIQFSLVESSPVSISQIHCDQNSFLNTDTKGLRGSATDSGVSVSPDLSVTASSSTDSPDKVISNSNVHFESNESSDTKAVDEMVTAPLSQERFSLVRRIQSASAMERKSSFPLPSSVMSENRSSLAGLSGSNSWGMRTCRCMSDGSWRRRSSNMSQSLVNSKMDSRIRLISTSSNLDQSLPRLQSHHSSSEEDWFEEVGNDSHEDIEVQDDLCSNGQESKKKSWQMVDLMKRLSTHEEDAGGKTSGSICSIENLSYDEPVTIPITGCVDVRDGVLGILHKSIDQTPQLSQLSTDGAIAFVGSTLAQTCFVNIERTLLEEFISNERREVASGGESSIAVGQSLAKKSTLGESSSWQGDPEGQDNNPRGSSESISKDKGNRTNTCKACCTVV